MPDLLRKTSPAQEYLREHSPQEVRLMEGYLQKFKNRSVNHLGGFDIKYEQPIFSSAIGADRFYWESVKVEFNKFFKHLDMSI